MLPKKKRLTTALFDQVFKSGKVQHSSSFWVRSFLLPQDKKPNPIKFGVVVAKKVFPTAVARNKVKRKIYEAIKKVSSIGLGNLGVIIGVKKDLADLSKDQIESELSVLLKKVLK